MDVAGLACHGLPMTTRRIKILRELRQFHGEWPNSWLGARDITVFRREAEGFAAAAGS